MVAESHLKASDLIMPFFVCEGVSVRDPVASMPGVFRMSIDVLVQQVLQARDLGIKMVALFPVIEQVQKDEWGSKALDADNIICRAIRAIKLQVPDIGVMADVALDPYTTHCHDGIIESGDVHNDKTIDVLVQQAILLAESGCDAVAPSDMMDGRVAAIRDALEAKGLSNTLIISYAAKYASAFYGPFRDAVRSNKSCGYLGKQTYQMDYRNAREAEIEASLDLEEGADMLIVKPGMPFLDVIYRVTKVVDVPVLAYQVSGEYAMLQSAAQFSGMSYDVLLLESLYAFKRAGASAIISYAALDVAQRLCR
jgi:porphobilinogen synthase